VARTVLLGAIYVEPWAPQAVYVLDALPDGTFSITVEETQTAVGTAEISRPASVAGATFTLREAAAEYAQVVVAVSTFDKAVLNLREALIVSRPNREAAIVTVRYESSDTQLVRLVPNALASRYIAQGQRVRKREATSTVAFLEDQIDTLSIQLRQAEEATTGFRELNQVVSLQAEADAQVTQMASLLAQRNVIEAERDALQSLVSQIDEDAEQADPADPSP
jgi:tyrosine-protein kinase Etk/Wzc